MSNGVEQLSKKGAVLASLDRSGVETCAARRSVSLAATGATGSYPARLWRQCAMAAALCLVTGGVCSKHAYRGTSWTALTLEVGKSPTATPRRAELPVA